MKSHLLMSQIWVHRITELSRESCHEDEANYHHLRTAVPPSTTLAYLCALGELRDMFGILTLFFEGQHAL